MTFAESLNKFLSCGCSAKRTRKISKRGRGKTYRGAAKLRGATKLRGGYENHDTTGQVVYSPRVKSNETRTRHKKRSGRKTPKLFPH